eukprot:10294488-Ditylum_brightwellii.AAC.1
MPKKTSQRGAAYTSTKKRFLATIIGMVKPISEGGWERAHSSVPLIPVEVREAKLAWLQICARLECIMVSSNTEEDGSISGDGVEEEEDDDDTYKKLLGPGMTQSIPTLSKRM